MVETKFRGFMPAGFAPRDTGYLFEVQTGPGPDARKPRRAGRVEDGDEYSRDDDSHYHEKLPVGLVREFLVLSLPAEFSTDRAFLCSARHRDRALMYERAEQLVRVCRDEKEVIRAVVSAHNPGGIMLRCAGLSVFVPGSLSGAGDEEARREKFPEGTPREIVLSRVDRRKGRIVGSIVDADANKAFRDIKVGALVSGQVRRLTNFGAYVGLEGTRVSGLLHVSNLSNEYVKSAGDILKEGDRVRCIVAGFEPGFKNISLSTAELEAFPGQILNEFPAVMANAEAQAAEFRKYLAEYVDDHEEEVREEMEEADGGGGEGGAPGGRAGGPGREAASV